MQAEKKVLRKPLQVIYANRYPQLLRTLYELIKTNTMRNISTRVKILSLISICLWIIGTFLLFNENNGKVISIIAAIILIAGLYSLVLKDQKDNSEL